ncbi:Bug family tripartite tricarboxylate transporter substrate binding protein [Ramlibacter sp.]|uniref:Bug family tripartite tricarboxylate transporter substrate binding protein n=1 Tax=Ramlibacter sp. TaxID=1917967 RepID=UPI0035B1E948
MQTRHRAALRRSILMGLLATAAVGLPSAHAAEFGKTPVKLVVPFAPAGATDFIARTIAPRLSEKFGTQFVVVNTAGAAGTIGAASVANAEPDGNTLLVYHIAMVTTHHVQKNMPFDPLKSFTPIGMLAEASNVIAVNPNLPARTLAELVDHAKKNPGKVNFGSAGIGGSDHLGGELMQMVTQTKLTHVPYKGGGPATAAVVAGEIEMNAGTVAQVVPMIKAGRLRALAVLQTERSPALPDVPSASEAGFPALDHKTWFGLWGPAKMPPELVTRINAALREVLARDDVRQAMANVGVDPKASTPQEFDTYIRAQHTRWDKVLAGRFVQ